MNKIQLAIIVIFGIVIVVALLVFSGALPGLRFGGAELGTITIWGTMPQSLMGNILEGINLSQKQVIIRYAEKNSQTFESELLNALATGRGPDIFMLPQDLILKHQDKIYLLTSGAFPERTYRDVFVDEGDLYITQKGILGAPFFLDPLVLYWNRALFRNAGIVLSPRTWDEFLTDSQKLTAIDPAGKITQSGNALGTFQNVRHSKEILSLLILQTGNPIVDKKTLRATLTDSRGLPLNPAKSALRFFVDFADRQTASYSWNKTMPFSDEMFIGEKLAMYFGLASEYNDIKTKNPHLDFDVAEVPQVIQSQINSTFGKMQAFAISNMSKNIPASLAALGLLIRPEVLKTLSDKTFLPPVRRDLLAQGSPNPALSVFMKSAIRSEAWLDPDPSSTSKIFEDMADLALGSKRDLDRALSEANLKLESLLANLPPR